MTDQQKNLHSCENDPYLSSETNAELSGLKCENSVLGGKTYTAHHPDTPFASLKYGGCFSSAKIVNQVRVDIRTDRTLKNTRRKHVSGFKSLNSREEVPLPAR